MAPLAKLIDAALGAGIQVASACARLKLPRFGLSACKRVELLSALREDSASWAIFKSIFMSWTRLISPFPRSRNGAEPVSIRAGGNATNRHYKIAQGRRPKYWAVRVRLRSGQTRLIQEQSRDCTKEIAVSHTPSRLRLQRG